MRKDKELITIAEFAYALQISEWTARKWLREGKVRGRKIGGGKEWRIPREEIDYCWRQETFHDPEGIPETFKKAHEQIIKISDDGHNDVARDIYNLIEVYDEMVASLQIDMEALLKKHKIKPPKSLREAKMIRLEGSRHRDTLEILAERWVENEIKLGGFKDRMDYLKHIYQLMLEEEKRAKTKK
jgi:excisionase family DNA binding protein